MSDSGAIEVVRFLKALLLEIRRGFDVTLGGCSQFLDTWLTCGGGACSMMSELLHRGRGSATMT
jgi:hypothetical protein